MLNFRKLKHDLSPTLLKEGKGLYDKQAITLAKIVALSPHQVRIHGQVIGSFEHVYGCEVEIDLNDSTIIDSECDCPHHFDCQHLSSLLFYLETHYDKLVVAYSKETNLEECAHIDEVEKETLLETIKEAASKEEVRRDQCFQKELLQEYVKAAQVLGQSPFFLPEERLEHDGAELTLIFGLPNDLTQPSSTVELQLALRLPYRAKLLLVPHLGNFLEAIRYHDPIYIGTKRYFFDINAFVSHSALILRHLLDFAQPCDGKGDKSPRLATMHVEHFGALLSELYDNAAQQPAPALNTNDDNEWQGLALTCLYQNGQEEPLRFSRRRANLKFALEYLSTPAPSVLIKPTIHLDEDQVLHIDTLQYFACALPGMIANNAYYRFQTSIKRKHLRNLAVMRDLMIPEPLFGTFVENGLAELIRYGTVLNQEAIERFVTMPFTNQLKAECNIDYLNGELEAELSFIYDDFSIPSAPSQINYAHMVSFVGPQGILARNLDEEQSILDDLFQGFTYHSVQGTYAARSEKKIIEFMTEVIPRNQNSVTFHCPDNLLDQFIYDQTTFALTLKESDRVDVYEVSLKVDGHLNGVTLDKLWECLSAKRAYIELDKRPANTRGRRNDDNRTHKILVLDLDRLAPIVQLFDEIGLKQLTNHKELRPLWSLANLDSSQWKNLPVKFSMSKRLVQIQEQMLGLRPMSASDVPEIIQAQLRPYQIEGVQWLERLRTMHLNGILADDMGLGKTLQAIIAVTQQKLINPEAQTLIVAPTSLLYNWKEEFHKFNPKLSVLVIDGTPQQRRKLIADIGAIDVIITSYSLLQKDTDLYREIAFTYAILDEAQHIKNRGTRNAKSVKMVQASHRLILTGTPIENSLDELWSLFDFLMPGFLSSYDRFVEKFVRGPRQGDGLALETLRRKVSPFILRRMKRDVLKELPPVSEIVYHCHLSETQRELYRSYAASAREELAQLVKKEGFERVQIHVLATLTRLKQICCHPAIFAKDDVENGDSAKYDMLIELLQTLIEGGHKTVIFSQYTRMLAIMRDDFLRRGISFEYLDGSSKHRLEIVKRFNENPSTSVFLVSLKAGGVGLNLTTANTVIHFDMWWNPAVEDQATARAHRIGQEQNVTVIKLITLNTIEEKILSLQQRKQGVAKQIISSEEELITKLLTWNEVLELLQT